MRGIRDGMAAYRELYQSWSGAVLSALLAVGLAGCGAARASTPPAPPVPRVALVTLRGQEVAVPNGKPTVLYFVSAQCSSCVDGLHQLTALAQGEQKAVRWLAVDVTPQYDPPDAIAAMMAEAGARWPVAYATNAVLQAYHVTSLDQLAVVSSNGRLIYDGGRPSDAELSALLRREAQS